MRTREDALNLLEIALQHSKADQTEVLLLGNESGLTRMANSSIHQNVVTTNTEARVRAVIGKRVGVAASNRVSADGLRELVDRAIAIARVSAPNPEFVSLPTPEPYTPTPLPNFDQEWLSPEYRADAATVMTQTAIGNGHTGAGHVSTAHQSLAVGNSLGVRAYHEWMESSVMAIMTCDGDSGYAQWSGKTLNEAPVGEVTARAARVCATSRNPVPIAPGPYTVILEPPAVAEMLSLLAFMGLSATSYQEERSFMNGKLGEALVGANISLRDDAFHADTISLPFDFEGVPKRVVPFFDRGVARGVVYDTLTAHKGKVASTGHALPAPSSYSPLPMHLVMDPGGESRDALIAGVQRGVLVTRFHYTNVVHPTETIFTGMTRDGTFLIEDGSISRPIKNMRFTQSILEALRRVSGIEHFATLVNQEGLYCLVPTLRIEDFNFTSVTG